MIKTRKIKIKSIENEEIIMAMTMTKTLTKVSSVFCCALDQLFKSQGKKPHPFLCIAIFNNKKAQ